MPNEANAQVSRFVWRHPWWSGTIIAAVAILLAAAIPVVGGTLAVIVLLGGTVAELVVWNTVNSAQRALTAPPSAPQLPPAPYPVPIAEPPQVRYSVERLPVVPVPPPVPVPVPVQPRLVPKMPPAGRAKPQRPKLAEIVAQLRIDETARELDEQVEVAGETFYSRQIKAVFRGAEMVIASGGGSTLRNMDCVLVPDPWNDHDENAVAVFIDGHQVGHLPAELAEDYALPLRQIAERGLLVPGRARIWAKDDGGVIWARVTLLIPAVVDL